MSEEKCCEAIMESRQTGMINHHHHGKGGTETLLDKNLILKELAIKPGQHIIDAGCGNGYMANEFSLIIKEEGTVHALDTHQESLKQLIAKFPQANIITMAADITKTTAIKPESIDLIYLSTVFHGFNSDDISGFQQESKRVLKKKGRIAIVEIQKKYPLWPS